MKRLLSSLAVVIVLILVTIPAFAQETTSPILSVSQPTSRVVLIQSVAAGFNLSVGSEVSALRGSWSGDLDLTDIDSAIKPLLAGTGYQPVITGKTVTVAKQADTQIATAQEGVIVLPSGNISVNMRDIETYKVVRAIAEKLGSEVVFQDLPAAKISADFIDISANAVLGGILSEQGFGFEEDKADKTIHVRKVEGKTQSIPRQIPTRISGQSGIATPGTEAYRLRRMDPNYDPCAYGDYGCQASIRQIQAPERTEAPSEIVQPIRDRRVSSTSDSEAYRLRRMSPEYNYGGEYGYSEFGNPYYEAQRRRIEGASRMGWLKIYGVGDTNFVKHLVVVRRAGQTWVAVGAGGKAFRSFHDPMELPVGHHTLRFEIHLDDGTMKCHERDFEIESKFDRDHAPEYPISGGMFKSYPGCK